MGDLVWHYCSMETFKAIVENKTIRFQDIMKSNDFKEMQVIVPYIDDAFEKGFKKNSQVLSKKFDSEYIERLFCEMMKAFFGTGLEGDNKLCTFFVSCYSLFEDSLGQWRGYADDGRGVSIGFDKAVLESITVRGADSSFTKIHSGEVVYKDVEQKASVEGIMNELFDKLVAYDKTKMDNNQIMKLFMNSFINLYMIAIFAKSAFFEEENEWRMFIYYPFDSFDVGLLTDDSGLYSFEVKYIARVDEIIPAIDMTFNSSLIRTITLGPKNRSDVSDVESYLKKNGYNCEVKKSYGSYR